MGLEGQIRGYFDKEGVNMAEMWQNYDMTNTIRDVQNNFDYEKKNTKKKCHSVRIC